MRRAALQITLWLSLSIPLGIWRFTPIPYIHRWPTNDEQAALQQIEWLDGQYLWVNFTGTNEPYLLRLNGYIENETHWRLASPLHGAVTWYQECWFGFCISSYFQLLAVAIKPFVFIVDLLSIVLIVGIATAGVALCLWHNSNRAKLRPIPRAWLVIASLLLLLLWLSPPAMATYPVRTTWGSTNITYIAWDFDALVMRINSGGFIHYVIPFSTTANQWAWTTDRPTPQRVQGLCLNGYCVAPHWQALAVVLGSVLIVFKGAGCGAPIWLFGIGVGLWLRHNARRKRTPVR